MPRTTRGRSRRLTAATAVLTIGLGLVLSGCAEHAEPTTTSPASSQAPGDTAGETAAPEVRTIDITVEGDTVTPSGERVDATVGEQIILHVTADAPGEIHVHSTPEQELSYEVGTSDLALTIDQPGVVEVESHTLDLVIVQLEVR